MNLGASRDSLRECGDMPERSRGVHETTCPQSVGSLLAGELQATVTSQASHGRQERSIEQSLMETPNLPLDIPPLRMQCLTGVSKLCGTSENPQCFLIARHQVGSGQARQLEPVLECTEESIGSLKFLGFSAADIAALGECPKR